MIVVGNVNFDNATLAATSLIGLMDCIALPRNSPMYTECQNLKIPTIELEKLDVIIPWSRPWVKGVPHPKTNAIVMRFAEHCK